MKKNFRSLILITSVLFALLAFNFNSASADTQNAMIASSYACFPLNGSYVCSAAPTTAQFVEPAAVEDEFVIDNLYGRIADNANVYAGPSRASEIVRNVGDGFLYASIYSRQQNEAGELWYMINAGEFVHGDEIQLADQSMFRGVEITSQPQRPFGWVVSRNFTPSSEPGGDEDPRFGEMYRYDFFEVYGAVADEEGWLWYSLGDGRWIKQTHVSLVDVDPRPEGVGPDEFWVEVDLYEQTLSAYEGDQMVFATLVSTGLKWWPTREGLFQVWDRWTATKMSGAEGREDYYFVEDVPHTMYFDRTMEIALHGAYWHDRFGYTHSHGCVNMPVQDSEWVFQWSEEAENDLWVWVQTSDPSNYFDRNDPEEQFAAP